MPVHMSASACGGRPGEHIRCPQFSLTFEAGSRSLNLELMVSDRDPCLPGAVMREAHHHAKDFT